MDFPKRKCKRCQGTGLVIDSLAIGKQLKSLRISAGIRTTDMATAMGLDIPNYTGMENGRRGWTSERIDEFMKLIVTMEKRK